MNQAPTYRDAVILKIVTELVSIKTCSLFLYNMEKKEGQSFSFIT